MAFFKEKILDWLGYEVTNISLSDAAVAAKLEHAAVKEAALYTAISLVADLISSCEIQVFEDGKPVKNSNWYTFNVSANPNETPSQVISKWVMKHYYKGESIMVPLSKHLYVADSFAVDRYPVKGDIYMNVAIDNFQSNRKFRADNVYCLRQDNPRIKRLVSDIFEIYGELLEYSRKAYAQGSGEKYALQVGKLPSGTSEDQKKAMEDIKERMQTFVDATSAALPLTSNQTIQRLSSATSATSSSVDYPALRKEVYSIVAETLHLPAGLLEGNLTSVDQVFNQALTTAIDPLANKMSQELTRKTYTQEEITGRNCRIRVNTSFIKHIDIVDAADKLEKHISDGLLCIDEEREIVGLPALGTEWSQTHFITKNYTEVNALDPLEGGE